MALVGNNCRIATSPLRYQLSNATIAAFGQIGSVRQFFNQDGKERNFWVGEGGINQLSAEPSGARPPVAWRMAPKNGGMSSRNLTKIDLTGSGLGVGGKPISGSSDITFSVTGTGGLIVSGSGTATIEFNVSGTILSVASGSGTANITLTATALIGAQAGMSGSSTVTLTGTAGSYAIGYLAGISTNETEFSAGALAAAVWDALLADHALTGSMGAALAAAGSAGDPWSTPLPGSYGAGTAGQILGSNVLTEADLNKIADIVLRRATANIEASSDGDPLTLKSLYGMISQGVHKTSISGSTLTVTRSDETTTLGTRTITTDVNAPPIVGFDTD